MATPLGFDLLPEEPRRPKLSAIPLVVGGITVVLLAAWVDRHLSEAREFAGLAERAEPWWLLVAVVLQVATYAMAGAIWQRVARFSERRLPLPSVARLSLVKLTVDQLMPSGGMAGNVVVARALRHMGFPAEVALEALLVDLLAYYCSFAASVALGLLVLWLHHGVTGAVLAAVGAFSLILVSVPSAILWLLRHRDFEAPRWLRKLRTVSSMLGTIGRVSPERVQNPELLFQAGLLNLAVFVLDGATLWAVLRALGGHVHVLTAFVALVMASVAGTISVLPGGLGTFEAGCFATLTLLGVNAQLALTGTLLLRGLSLWIPLVPGMILARHELGWGSANERRSDRGREIQKSATRSRTSETDAKPF